MMTLESLNGAEPDFCEALAAEGLPAEDIDDLGRAFFRIVDGVETVGFGGYELYGENALLRSIVVRPERRGQCIGQIVTKLLLGRAYTAGARKAYLLTNTAEAFFEKLGFEKIARESAPADILQTRQAAGLCSSATPLMVRELRG